MSETLWGVIIGASLTGIFLIGAQLLSSRSQANAAREAWDRSHAAQERAELESACLTILRYTQQIDHAVAGWEDGELQSTQAHGLINAGTRDLMQAGLPIVLHAGINDPTSSLIGDVVSGAQRYSDLNLVGRNPPATALEKRAQSESVKAAVIALAAHLHEMVKAAAKNG